MGLAGEKRKSRTKPIQLPEELLRWFLSNGGVKARSASNGYETSYK